ncbi:MAG: PIN domain-containing protein [Verrucomicrobia bacterium]|nr:PIN domain-containing protein [Verrucomicrobiota bacterium]MDA1066292.1 PIN domain-containing protein [Verrucomicrobiota bacterium]
MRKRAVIDSGPLIALFDRDDAHHEKTLEFLGKFNGTLYSTIAVITEVSHLLDFNAQVQWDFLDWVADGGIHLIDLDKDDIRQIGLLAKKYSDVPMDFADASLVVVAEKLKLNYVVSIDSDFLIYRTSKNKYLENLIDLHH